MTYTPIEVGPDVPEPVRLFIVRRVEPLLRDIRLMLTAPGHPHPGLNLSIATVLFSVIGGLARVFFNHIIEDGRSFKAVAQRYPMSDEPADAIRSRKIFADTLYGMYRCNLVHSLGLNMVRRIRVVKGKKRRGRWTIVTAPDRYVVARSLLSSPAQLDEIERLTCRPPTLKATLKREDGKVRLDVDALYRGVRLLVHGLAREPMRQRIAERLLKEWLSAEKATEAERANYVATLSSTTANVMHFSPRHGLEESLGAVPTDVLWDRTKENEDGAD